MLAAEEEFNKKTNIINLFMHIEQVSLLKKIILNESQNFMLEKRGLQNITNTNIKSAEELKLIQEENQKEKKNKLINYLKEKTLEESLSDVDNLLMNYMNDEEFDKINKIIEEEL